MLNNELYYIYQRAQQSTPRSRQTMQYLKLIWLNEELSNIQSVQSRATYVSITCNTWIIRTHRNKMAPPPQSHGFIYYYFSLSMPLDLCTRKTVFCLLTC